MIITFFQFCFVTLASYFSQFEAGAPYTVRRPRVPLSRWSFIAFMFFAINMLNNWAFAYNISVPVHIILRSFGSVTTMIAGYLRGKRYSPLQVFSVVLLTVGVLISAWADSESKVSRARELPVAQHCFDIFKGKSMSAHSSTSSSDFAQGLGILLVAQFMSAWMGAYTEDTYAEYKASWTENMFYSHFLSLPLFLPMASTLQDQYSKLIATPSVDAQAVLRTLENWGASATLVEQTSRAITMPLQNMPQGLLYLLTNTVTQLVCISGVNLLSAKSSAVTVTIVLNIRKLVSFILSTILFGHQLDTKMVIGSTLVFGSGALYGWETSWRIPRRKTIRNGQNGTPKSSGKQQKLKS